MEGILLFPNYVIINQDEGCSLHQTGQVLKLQRDWIAEEMKELEEEMKELEEEIQVRRLRC